jgi:hypothetical protein
LQLRRRSREPGHHLPRLCPIREAVCTRFSTTPLLHFSASPLYRFADGWTDGVPSRNADVICVHPSIRPRSGKVEKRKSGEAEKWTGQSTGGCKGGSTMSKQRRMTPSSALLSTMSSALHRRADGYVDADDFIYLP